MNILILTQWFDPEPNNMKALAFAKGLKKKGHSVQVLTGFPNYPTGRIFQGYQLRLYQEEIMDHIPIHRVLLYPSHDANPIRRVINYTSFAFFASFLGPLVMKGPIDVIYVYHPPATIMVPALIIGKIKKAGILFDSNDLWPDTLTSTGMMKKKWPIKIIDHWMNYCYRKADRINVLSKGIKELLIQRNVPAEKISTIPIWCNESLINHEVNSTFYNQYLMQNRFTGIYAGAMGKAQHLTTLIKAAEVLQEKVPEFALFLIGHGVCLKELKELAEKKNLNNVIFVPVMPPEQLTSILNGADVLLVHLKKDPLFVVTIPSKLAYYMAIGKPIVAGLEGNAADIIYEAEGGVVCTPEDYEAMAAGIEKLYLFDYTARDQMSEKNRTYYLDHMSMEAGITKFETALFEIIKERNRV